MRIRINGSEIELNKEEVKSCKKVILDFINKTDEICKEKSRPTYYYTFLIMMHIISQETLDNIDAERLALIMRTFEEARNA